MRGPCLRACLTIAFRWRGGMRRQMSQAVSARPIGPARRRPRKRAIRRSLALRVVRAAAVLALAVFSGARRPGVLAGRLAVAAAVPVAAAVAVPASVTVSASVALAAALALTA